jgi:hypothetical protein
MELSLLRQRSFEALKLKAARCDLHTTVAIGFVRSEDDRIELDPDLRIRPRSDRRRVRSLRPGRQRAPGVVVAPPGAHRLALGGV